MGDRTYCEIKIHKHYYDQLENSIGEDDPQLSSCYEDMDEDGDDVKMYDCEANYGCMEALESLLHDRKIEYDKRWEAGGDYGPGEEYARIVGGEYRIHELSDEGLSVLTEHKESLEIITTGGTLEDIKKHLEAKVKLLEPFEVTPLKSPQSIDFIKNA